MDEDAQLNERKPLEDDLHNEPDEQPVPDEILELANGDGRVWLVKIPKFLMERWQEALQPNLHLATMRVYNDKNNDGKTRISLFLPDAPQLGEDRVSHTPYNTSGLSKEYALDIVNQEVGNQVVVSERTVDPPHGRAKSTHLLGSIIHECNVRPLFNNSYRDTLSARHKAANTPKRRIVVLGKDDVKGGRGALNKLSSGTAITPAFDDLVKASKKNGKEFERFARIPRDQLLDTLFRLFEEKHNWSFKELRARTEQPAEYLKEVLSLIAILHRSGEINGQYTLLENFRTPQNQDAIKREDVSNEGANNHTATSMGGEEGEDDDDDDDDDMEEVE